MKIRHRLRAVVTAAVGMSLLLVPLEASAAEGWADPVPGFTGLTDWMEYNCGGQGDYWTPGKVHVGSDYAADPGDPIRSIGDGEVYVSSGGDINESLWVRHKVGGTTFFAIYGHIRANDEFKDADKDGNGLLSTKIKVSAGEVLGTLRAHPDKENHLHFGVWEALAPRGGSFGTRDCAPGEPPVSTANNLRFRAPIPFLNANPGTYDPDDPDPEPGPDPTPEPEPALEDYFIDDNGSIFEDNHNWMAANGVTRGCNPPTNNRYCGDDNVTRGQMAAFLTRALALEPSTKDAFGDDNDSIFEADIQALANAGITVGCGKNAFCPDDLVTRGQMAAFLKRALNLPASSADAFTDDNDSIFERDIQALAAADVTRGCNPPTNNRFCPDDPVTRSQMAAFLERALG